MSTLFDHLTEALDDPDNIDLLLTTAASEDRRQVVRSSQVVGRQMLAAMAEMASDSSTVGVVQRNLALVSEADDDGPIRLIPGRFEAAGASLVGALSLDSPTGAEAPTCTDDPLAPPVAWLLAAVIGRHGPQSASPRTMAHFLDREHRRSIAPAPSTRSAPPPPSHHSAEPAPVPPPIELDPSVGSSDDLSGSMLIARARFADRDPVVLTFFVFYVLTAVAVLWLVSGVLAPRPFDVVLLDRARSTTETRPAPGAFLPTSVPVPTSSADGSAEPGDSANTAGEWGDLDIRGGEWGTSNLAIAAPGDQQRIAGEAGESGTRSGADPFDVSFTLVGPSRAPWATGRVEIVFDPGENQICHIFEIDGIADPFGRIGIGRSAEQAGVVVDLGRVEPGQRACTQVSSTAMEALVAAEADHFVEVSDAARVHVARGQSSAAAEAAFLQSSAAAEAAFLEEPAVSDGVDPAVVTAGLSARPGVLTLAGAAPSNAIADLLRGELAVLDDTGIEVVDQVTVDPTAGPPTGGIMVDQTNLFAVDSHDLSSDGDTIVRQLAILFQRNPQWTIAVSGHTDSTGDEINNLELGLRRATEVRDILTAEGVSAERITTEGVGAPFPIADNETPEGRAKNRRFEIEIRRP